MPRILKSPLIALLLSVSAAALPAASGLGVQISFTVTAAGNQAARPRIVSDPPVWAIESEPLRYDVVVNVLELLSAAGSGGRGSAPPFNLSFTLVGPVGMSVTKTGSTTARVDWLSPTPPGEHVRARLTTTETGTSTSDVQDLLLFVAPSPGAGN